MTEAQYKEMEDYFPKHRKPAGISNLDALNAALYVLENGIKWRAMPKEYGCWHTIYTRISRWAKSGVLQRSFLRLQESGVIRIDVSIVALDSASVKVHPDGMGALKKEGSRLSVSRGAAGTPKFIWSPHLTETR